MVGILWRTLKSPCSCSTVLPFLTAVAPIPLAQSIGEPPPNATIAWQLFSRKSCSPSRTFISVGFGWTPSYTVYLTPALSISSNMLSSMPSPRSPLSVTTSTLSKPFSRIHAGSFLMEPGPSRVSGIPHGIAYMPTLNTPWYTRQKVLKCEKLLV